MDLAFIAVITSDMTMACYENPHPRS